MVGSFSSLLRARVRCSRIAAGKTEKLAWPSETREAAKEPDPTAWMDSGGRRIAVPNNETELREELVKACKVLYACGVVDLVGHMSARLDDERILIKPRPVSWFNLTADDLIVMDFNGQRLDGPPTERTTVMEWPIHTEVYKARPDVNAVLHCHPVDSTLMASLDIEMEPLTRELLYFAGGVPVHDSRECLIEHHSLIDTVELGEEVAEVLGPDAAAILKYHGNVIAGRTIGEATVAAFYLERAAQTMLKASDARPLPAMDAERKAEAVEAWKHYPRFSPVIVAERWEMMKGYYLDRDRRQP
jgi:ribulose-5-phosphate 4-epimerase/fuculose-1-phosphate aldolase